MSSQSAQLLSTESLFPLSDCLTRLNTNPALLYQQSFSSSHSERRQMSMKTTSLTCLWKNNMEKQASDHQNQPPLSISSDRRTRSFLSPKLCSYTGVLHNTQAENVRLNIIGNFPVTSDVIAPCASSRKVKLNCSYSGLDIK